MTTATSAVVICAYTERRWDDLLDAVASARRQQPAPVEVVVVVDHHAELARRLREAVDPAVTVLENVRRRGLSGARNTALDHLDAPGRRPDGRVELPYRCAPLDAASPDVVAFLDDDAAARDGWLAALLAPYAEPDVAAVGGVAVPRWPGAEAPAVLPPELWWVVGCTYTGQHPEGAAASDTVEVRNLMGCSMSFRRSVFSAVGGFAEDMGRVGTIPLGCEETDLCLRLAAHDPAAAILLAPTAVVDHRVSDDRTGWRYLLRRSWAEGLSKAVLARAAGAGPALASERSYTARVLPAAVLRELRRGRGRGAAAVPAALAAAAGGYLRGRTARPTPPAAGAPLHQFTGRAALRSVPAADHRGVAS